MMRVVVTGANRGIGLMLAAEAEARGYDVVALVRGPLAAGHRLLRARLIEDVDVRDERSVARAAAMLGDLPVDVLINNAGVIGPARQSTLDMDFAGFRDTLEINTLGPLRVAQAFLPHLRAARRAKGITRIVTISSQMGRMNYAKSDRIAYRASKAAVNKLMQGLATDLAVEGIAVGVVDPGWAKTAMGGPDAEVDVAASACGILDQVMALDMSSTGRFVDYRGDAVSW